MKNLLIFFLLIILFLFDLKAQNTQAFYFVNLPHSVSTFGTGWQGVSSLTNDDALTYNPAKLTLTKNSKISFYRNPFQLVSRGRPYPLTNLSLYHKEDNIGSFGLSYENWDFGEIQGAVMDPNNPEGYSSKTFHYYERSFSAGYAKDINENFSGGAQLRYNYTHFGGVIVKGFFLSLGLLYNPDFCNNKFNIGFSLMNLGPAVKYEATTVSGETFTNYDPPPTKLNLGINFVTVENEYFTMPISLSISKPFDKRDDNGDGQSSFKTLFSDWSDFPNDASLQTGLSFIWKPLRLGNDFSFFQEFYFGNFSRGIKTYLENYYTHGINIGIEFFEYKFSMGYAGVSHNVHYPNYLQWVFPYETFQFTFELNDNLLFHRGNNKESYSPLESIILSLGLGHTARLGMAKGSEVSHYKVSYGNNFTYSFEASFYFDKRNALVSSVTYNSVPYDISYGSFKFIDTKFETFSFFSSYRYHPLGSIRFLFVQGGMGIYRWNPVIKTEPRYDYETALQLSTGLTLDFLTPLIIIPTIDYNLILYPSTGDAPRIQGYNQFNFILKVGYKII